MFRNILNTFGTKGFTAVINLAIAIILSQVLGASGKGEQGLIITTIAFILVFANLIGGATLVYFTPRMPYSVLLYPSYLWSILTAVISYFMLRAFNFLEPHLIIPVCILFLLSSFTSIHTSLLMGKEKIVTANFINFIIPVLTVVSIVVLFFVFKLSTLFSYIYSLYLAFGTTTVISFIYVIKYFGKPVPVSRKSFTDAFVQLMKYGFMNQTAHITQMLSFRLSYYVLEAYQGTSAVGIYSNGIQLAESIWLMSKSIAVVQYARISNVNDKKYAAQLTSKLIRISVVISSLFLLPLLLLPSSVFSFVFGPEFTAVKIIVLALSPGVIVYNISIISGNYFSGLGKYWVNAMVSSIGLVVSVALYFTLIPAYGYMGASYATSLSYCFTSILIFTLFIYKSDVPLISVLKAGKDDFKFIRDELFRTLQKIKN